MSRIAYVNGRYVPHRHARVHIEDRGYQFADGVYEVIAVVNGRMVDAEGHFDRLERCLRELSIPAPMGRAALRHILAEVVRRNRVRRGMVYLQITRGVARRDHAFPARARPSVVATARSMRPQPAAWVEEGVSVITVPDLRWKRRDIKTVGLLPNVMAKQQAKEAGAYEAWMIDDDGFITEGTASNAWIVTADNQLVTRHADASILCGVTRLAVADLAREAGLEVIERAFTPEEAKAAREAFITSTTSMLLPVVRIDGQPVGGGRPGPVARRLRQAYDAMAAGEGA